MEFSIFISCVLTNLFISESVITFSPSPVPTRRLYALYELALLIIFSVLNLILDYPGLELTVAVYRGLSTRWPLPCIFCVPYIPIQSSNVMRHYFWPIKAWDSLILKVENAGKASAFP
jgi:hypothetical protein